MTTTQLEQTPSRPVVNVKLLAARWWPVAAGVALLLGVVGYRQLSAEPPAGSVDPVVVERTPPSTSPVPKADPLGGFSKPPSPTTQALVGQAFEDRSELARRVNEFLGQGLNDCQVWIGSPDGVSWSISAVWSAAFASPVFAGCPWPPPKAAGQ